VFDDSGAFCTILRSDTRNFVPLLTSTTKSISTIFFSFSVTLSLVENMPPLSNCSKYCGTIKDTIAATAIPSGPNLAAIPPKAPNAPAGSDPAVRNDLAPSSLSTILSWNSFIFLVTFFCFFSNSLIFFCNAVNAVCVLPDVTAPTLVCALCCFFGKTSRSPA